MTPVYTDVRYSKGRESRGLLILRIGLAICSLLGFGWTAAMAWLSGFSILVLCNALISTLALGLLLFSRRLPLLLLTHCVVLMVFFYVWFIQLKLEGLTAPHQAATHWWFQVLTVGVFLLLLDSRKWVVTLLALANAVSFVACELAWVRSESLVPPSFNDLDMVRTVTHCTVFGAMLLLTLAWSVEVNEAEEGILVANDKLEELIANMLPPAISQRLRKEGKTFADGVAECSVLFADIVGFTPLSAEMPPQRLVALLDQVFSRFDVATTSAGLEKIKTIGDAYMVAGGLPAARADHAQALVRLALELRDIAREYGLKIRVGINSGSVVAGVIGKKRFIYDLWGDTVNVASRMESQGVVNEIQVSDATALLIQGEFELQPRGEMEIKGKGTMQVFLVGTPLAA